MSKYQLKINEKVYSVDVDPDLPLLWLLRDVLGMVGTKYGCGIGQCGACTVHVDGVAVRSCLTRISDIASKPIRTIEGLAESSGLHPFSRVVPRRCHTTLGLKDYSARCSNMARAVFHPEVAQLQNHWSAAIPG